MAATAGPTHKGSENDAENKMTTPADAYTRQQHAELVVQSAQKEREERYATIFFTALMACVLCCFAVALFATLFLQ